MDVQGHCSGQCLALSVVVPSSPLALIFYSVDAFQLVNRPYGEAHTGPSPAPWQRMGVGGLENKKPEMWLSPSRILPSQSAIYTGGNIYKKWFKVRHNRIFLLQPVGINFAS